MLGSEIPIPAQGGEARARDPECKGHALLNPHPSDLCRFVFLSFYLFPSLSLFLSHTRKHTQLTLHPAPGWLHPPPPLSLLLLNQWISGGSRQLSWGSGWRSSRSLAQGKQKLGEGADLQPEDFPGWWDRLLLWNPFPHTCSSHQVTAAEPGATMCFSKVSERE